MIKVEINQNQLKDIMSRIDPKFIDESMNALLGRVGAKGKAMAVNALKPEIPNRGTGYAQKSMQYRVRNLTATVMSMMSLRGEYRVKSIEEGRHPGEEVSARAISRWYTGNLYEPKDWYKYASKLHIYSVYQTQKYIKQLGTKGKRFISGTYEKLIEEMPSMLESIAKKIEKRWGQK